MTAIQMITNMRDEALEARPMYRDYEMIEALNASIEAMTTGRTEANKTKAAKVLLDVRDNLQYPEDYEIDLINIAIIALVRAA